MELVIIFGQLIMLNFINRFTAISSFRQIMFLCVVTPCSDVVGYQLFGGPCCLRRWEQHGPLERRSPTLSLYYVKTRKNATRIFIAGKT